MPVSKSETILRELLEPAGIEINGSDPWDMQVHDKRFYDRVFREVTLGMGESYMDGWWDCEAIDELICRGLKAKVDSHIKGNLGFLFFILKTKLFNLQSVARAFRLAKSIMTWGMISTPPCWINA